MADTRAELHKALREGQDKYIYFLLAVAGAAIGFAVTQTQTATLSFSKIPLGFAVAFWAFSFYCGCRQLLQGANILFANYQFIRMQEGTHPQFPPHPDLIREIATTLEEQADKAGTWGKLQFRSLIAGAMFFIGWHILEMYLRTFPV
jgi:hypothetical protein